MVLRSESISDYKRTIHDRRVEGQVNICIVEDVDVYKEASFLETIESTVLFVFNSPETAFSNIYIKNDQKFNRALKIYNSWGQAVEYIIDSFHGSSGKKILIGETEFYSDGKELQTLLSGYLGKFSDEGIDFTPSTNVAPIGFVGAYLIRDYWRNFRLYGTMQDSADIQEPEIDRSLSPSDLVINGAERLFDYILTLKNEVKRKNSIIDESQKKSNLLNMLNSMVDEFISLHDDKKLNDVHLLSVTNKLKRLLDSYENRTNSLTENLAQVRKDSVERASYFEKLLQTENEKNSYLKDILVYYRDNFASLKTHLYDTEVKLNLAECKISESQDKLDSITENTSKEHSQSACLKKQIELLEGELKSLKSFLANYSSKGASSNTFEIVSGDFSRHCMSNKIEVSGRYNCKGYENLTVVLNDVLLPDHRRLRKIQCKLVKNSSSVALEFRDLVDQQGLVDWSGAKTDKHGKYLIYDPKKLLDENNVRLVSKSDREVFDSVSSIIYLGFKENKIRLLECQNYNDFKLWRSRASELYANLQCSRRNLDFSSILLDEIFEKKNYRHLWIQLNDVVMCGNAVPSVSYKLSYGVDKIKKILNRNYLKLEFREQAFAFRMFDFWPPSNEDKYGVKFELKIYRRRNSVIVSSTELLSRSDQTFIKQIITSLNRGVRCLEFSKQLSEIDSNIWVDNINNVIRGCKVFRFELLSENELLGKVVNDE
ncbi:hypothetical protein NBRC116591_16040 [Sessilibacter corallicola]|uniref:Uncharacterized protein n=2 Tax=Sessilibacter corallicola TaxID=2904075 RepID=A0ABQ0A822_9GAMM